MRTSLSSDLSAPSTPMLADEGKKEGKEQLQRVSGDGRDDAQPKQKAEQTAATAPAEAAAPEGVEPQRRAPPPPPASQPPPSPPPPPLPPHHPHRHPLSLEWLRDEPPDAARAYLMSLDGLGRKSAACVSLLSLRVRDFPVDTNVGRVCARLGWLPLESEHALEQLDEYAPEPEVHRFLHSRLAARLEVEELHELHFQMITLGKVLCSKRAPNCCACPLRPRCEYARADGARLRREAGEAARAVAAAAAADAAAAAAAEAATAEEGGGALAVARRAAVAIRRAPALPTSAGLVVPAAATTARKEGEEGPVAAAAAPASFSPSSGPSALALERARTAAALSGRAAAAAERGEEDQATAAEAAAASGKKSGGGDGGGGNGGGGEAGSSSSSALAAEVARLIAAGDRMQETADGACGEGAAAAAGGAGNGPLELAARLADRAAAVLGFGEALAAFRAGTGAESAAAAGGGERGARGAGARVLLSRERRLEAAAALRRRYLALSSAIHPDKCPLPGAARAFAALQEAHGILAECLGRGPPRSAAAAGGGGDDEGGGGGGDDDDEDDDEDEDAGDAAIPYPAGRSRALRTAFVLPDELARRILSPELVKQHAVLKDEPFLLLEMPEAARGGVGREGGGNEDDGDDDEDDEDDGGSRGGSGGGGSDRPPPSSSSFPPLPPRSWRHNRLMPYFERLLEYRTLGEKTNQAAAERRAGAAEEEGALKTTAATPPPPPPPLPPCSASSSVAVARCALLVPVRTAMCGRFPLHGTYFQVNECFLDRSTLRAPLRVPVPALARLPTSDVHFGLSVIAVCRGMRRHQIARLFSRSRLCVRGYEPSTGCPAPLPPWILPEPPGGGGARRPKKGQAPKPARPPTALQAQLLALQAEAATREETVREGREGKERCGAADADDAGPGAAAAAAAAAAAEEEEGDGMPRCRAACSSESMTAVAAASSAAAMASCDSAPAVPGVVGVSGEFEPPPPPSSSPSSPPPPSALASASASSERVEGARPAPFLFSQLTPAAAANRMSSAPAASNLAVGSAGTRNASCSDSRSSLTSAARGPLAAAA